MASLTPSENGESSEPPRICQAQEATDRESRPRATPREVKGGYECEFVEPPDSKLLQSECSICLLILREPHIVSCCGHSFCETCIRHVQRDGKPCPLCNEPDFTTMANKGLKRTLNEFQVHCSHRELGCEWVGELGKLNHHLNVNPQPERQLEGCPFTSVKCSHCKDHIRRHVIAGHQIALCPQRPYTCEYCEEYESTFEDVVDHWAECKCYLLMCPNNCNASESGIERQNLEHHMKEECPLTVVECDFHYAGCGVKLPRKDMAGHMKEDSVAHISLLAAENQRLAKQLLERDKIMQQLMQQNAELRNRIDQQRNELTQTVQRQQAAHLELASKVAVLVQGQQQMEGLRQRSQILPMNIKMDGFKELKDNNCQWFSLPFYTHMCAYKMCLCVYANGTSDGEGTHVSVYTYLMRGEFDSHLKWPFRGDITIQLLNRLENRRHHSMTINYNDKREDVYAGRVTVGEKALGWGIKQFISHSLLNFNRSKNCQFIKNDDLIFRVSVKLSQ